MFCSSGSPQLSKLERRHHHKLLRYLISLTNHVFPRSNFPPAASFLIGTKNTQLGMCAFSIYCFAKTFSGPELRWVIEILIALPKQHISCTKRGHDFFQNKCIHAIIGNYITYGAKVLGQLCDSRTSYISSVTISASANNFLSWKILFNAVMFDECVFELWPEMATRRPLINLIRAFLHILSVALH